MRRAPTHSAVGARLICVRAPWRLFAYLLVGW